MLEGVAKVEGLVQEHSKVITTFKMVFFDILDHMVECLQSFFDILLHFQEVLITLNIFTMLD